MGVEQLGTGFCFSSGSGALRSFSWRDDRQREINHVPDSIGTEPTRRFPNLWNDFLRHVQRKGPQAFRASQYDVGHSVCVFAIARNPDRRGLTSVDTFPSARCSNQVLHGPKKGFGMAASFGVKGIGNHPAGHGTSLFISATHRDYREFWEAAA